MTTLPELITPPTVSVRHPRLAVFVDGNPLFNVLDCTVTRGLDQELSTCQFSVPSGLPAFVRKFSQITVFMAAHDAAGTEESFVGYLVDWQAGLWPGTMTLLCEDPLTLAKGWYNDGEDGIDQHGRTDVQAVRQVLERVGFASDQLDLDGVGKKLGKIDEANLYWEQQQSALSRIQDIDSVSLGYKTYALSSGRIVRRLITTIPTEQYVWEFTEGIDVLDGSMSSEKIDPANLITVQGDGVKSQQTTSDDPRQWRKSPYFKKLKLLKVQATNDDYLSAEEVAAWLLGRLGKWILKVDFSTHLDIPFQTGESVRVVSDHMDGLNNTLWVQSYSRTIDASGVFTASFTAVSELNAFNRGSQTPLVTTAIPLPGTPLPLPPITPPIPPSSADIIVDFAIAPVLGEIVLIADVPTVRLDIGCSDTSTSRQGTITTRAWTATGGSAAPASGAGKYFTFAVADLASASVTLTVTDSNGSTKALTRPLAGLASSVRYRKLYAASGNEARAFDGATWRTYTPSTAATIAAVANGPLWAAGTLVVRSTDDLQTAGLESEPFGVGEDVTALWTELDVAASKVAAGSALGRVALSTDGAATWTAYPGPTSDPVLRIIISRFVSGQLHLINASGYWVSDSFGRSWRLIRAGSFVDLRLGQFKNIVLTAAGAMERAEDGTPFTFPGTPAPIVAATVHIRDDRYYAMASDGATYGSAAAGSYAMELREPIPEGLPVIRGLERDGVLVDLLYFCAGSGGLFKTVSGFKADGYFKLAAA